MAINPILGRDVYLALAAVGWADGQLTTLAADAIVRTALAEGLEFEDVAAIEEATQKPIDVGVIDRMNMSKSDRLYVYAVAAWIAELDGHMSEPEKDALAKLGEALKVPEAPRHHAGEIMKEIASRADKPERFDLLALRRTLDERLNAAQKARIQAGEASKPEPDTDAPAKSDPPKAERAKSEPPAAESARSDE